MIKNRDLVPVPIEVARAMLRDDRADTWEHVARELGARSLDRVLRVVRRLVALGSVVDPGTREVLLSEVSELDTAVAAAHEVLHSGAARRSELSPSPATAGVGFEVALLDVAGVVVWVNQAWNDFCRANGGDPHRAGVGRSYLALCDDAGDDVSADVARMIRLAVRGRLPAPARLLVPCPAPNRARVFDTLVSSRLDDRGVVLGATVTLSEAGESHSGSEGPGLVMTRVR